MTRAVILSTEDLLTHSQRLISCLLLLKGKPRTTARELSRHLAVSMRTVYRDVEALCEAGVPIHMERGSLGGIIASDYRRAIAHITDDELQALFAVGPGPMSDIGLASQTLALQKLAGALPAIRGRRPRRAAIVYSSINTAGAAASNRRRCSFAFAKPSTRIAGCASVSRSERSAQRKARRPARARCKSRSLVSDRTRTRERLPNVSALSASPESAKSPNRSRGRVISISNHTGTSRFARSSGSRLTNRTTSSCACKYFDRITRAVLGYRHRERRRGGGDAAHRVSDARRGHRANLGAGRHGRNHFARRTAVRDRRAGTICDPSVFTSIRRSQILLGVARGKADDARRRHEGSEQTDTTEVSSRPNRRREQLNERAENALRVRRRREPAACRRRPSR